MPFDGNPAQIKAKLRRDKRKMAQEASDLLCSVHHKFSTGEWRWMRWSRTDGEGFCMIGGLEREAEIHEWDADAAIGYLACAIKTTIGCKKRRLPEMFIVHYNDTYTFTDVMKVLSEAKLLAESDMEAGDQRTVRVRLDRRRSQTTRA